MTASFFEKILWNIYIVDRNKTTFEHVEEVPSFVSQMVPIFLTLLISEEIIHFLKSGTRNLRVNDGITSVALGIIMEVVKVLTKGFELYGYQWLYEYRLIHMDWQSPLTWWAAAILVDFGYYWVHRSAHEISLFWCGHQVHHSSEDYNLTTALRQSAFQRLFSIGFYQPLALLGVPLPALLVHNQLNLFYQFWIHTELVSNLGPLEWIFNTASHHRVHHGTNKWCLDKNYAGFLIIWDRMFGTFEPERKDEKIVYGLISQPQTFNPLYLQIFYFKQVLGKAFSMKTLPNFFKALFYGPGWQPGTSRLGNIDAIPEETQPRAKFNPVTPLWLELYLLLHFVIVVYMQQSLTIQYASFSWAAVLVFIGFIFFTLFTIGGTFDGHWWAAFAEAVRCIAMVAVLRDHGIMENETLDLILLSYFAISTFIWSSTSLTLISSKLAGDKMKVR